MKTSRLKNAMVMASEYGDVARHDASSHDEAMAIAQATADDWMARPESLDYSIEDEGAGLVSVAGWSEQTPEGNGVEWRLNISY